MIKLFEQYNEYSQVKDWLDEMGIENYTINDDLTVDVNGGVDISRCNLNDIPIQFGRVDGYFNCGDNNLTSLKGCPMYIYNSFDCYTNRITSLEYFPNHIGSYVNITTNKLTSLKCPPVYIGSIFLCTYNPLPIEIKHFPKITIVIKHQEEYGIWNVDGSFNQGRFDLFKKDYEAGIFKEE